MSDGQVPVTSATYVWAARPADVFLADARERLRVRSGAAEVYLSGDTPVPAGKTVTEGVLVLTATEASTGSRTVTVQRVNPARRSLRLLTWDNRPGVDPASVPVSVTQAGTVLQWRFDVAADLAFEAAGGNLRGWLVTTTENVGGRFFHGPQARRSAQRPRVEASWVAKPPAPSKLVPSVGAVGVAKPVLGWASTVPFTALQVQVGVNDAGFVAPLVWDSGEKAGSVPTLALAATTVASGTIFFDTFASFGGAEVWAESSTHTPWYVQFNGGGTVGTALDGTNKVVKLVPAIQPASPATTTAALVTSTLSSAGDLTLTAKMRTLSQNAGSRSPAEVPNPWEVAWLYWNYTDTPGTGEQGTGTPSTTIRRSYYIALKPNGWELGKLDQGVFTASGGQRYLASNSTPTFPVGTAWHDVKVEQTGDTIKVTVDGTLLTTFTDGPGSGGTPAWGTAGETVFTAGRVGLYTEDAHVQFDDVKLLGAPPAFPGLANLDDRDWRVRIKNAAGWSPWSLPGRLARTDKPVVVLTNPGATSGDGTPPFTWTVTPAAQTTYRALLYDSNDLVRWDSGLVPGTALTVTPTKGLRADGAMGVAEIRVDDGVDREATPGDRGVARDTQAFTLDLSGGTTPGVTWLTATAAGGSAAVDVAWGRSEPPDFWHVLRDGVTVAVLVGTVAYAFRDWTAQPFVSHDYEVLAEVNGVKSSCVPESVTTRPRHVWLADPTTNLAAPILTDDDGGSWPRGVTEEVHAVVGGAFAVRVVSSLRGYEGITVAGVVAGVAGLSDGEAAIGFVTDLAEAPSRVVRLITGDLNLPVVTSITLAPDSRTREGDRVKGIELTAWQQDEPGPVTS